MSRLSIYETRWIDVVFENRNKEYGAYQLRHESVKSSLTALLMGLLFVVSIWTIVTISSNFNPEVIPETTPTDWKKDPIHLTNVVIQDIEKPAAAQAQSQTTKTTVTQAVLRDPIIVAPTEATPDLPTNIEIKNTGTEASTGTGAIGNSNSTSSGTGTGPETTTSIYDGPAIANAAILDKNPEFPGGIDQFYKYVGNNFEKPEMEAMSTIKIFVSFVIEKDGSMSDIQVKRDPGYGLGKEAVRVLKSLKTKWSPGIIDSKPVRTAYNLPIIVKIN